MLFRSLSGVERTSRASLFKLLFPPGLTRHPCRTVAVENAIYRDERIKDCAVVPVPDEKLGELVA